jgi:hypothetical protein
MCCEHLVCANCAGQVADAGCPVCRSARAELHAHPQLPVTMVLALAALLAFCAVLSAHLAG